MMNQDCDALVIGSGINGLAAAATLAKKGWKALVLERNQQIGGAVRSGEVTLPGLVHDLWSTNQNLFLSSPIYKDMHSDLERQGLSYARSDKPFCNLFPEGKSLRVYRDAEKTQRGLREHNPEDEKGWQELKKHFSAFEASLLPLYQTPLPSAQAAWALLKAFQKTGAREIYQLMQIILSSTQELGESFFESPEARALIACWGMHMDFGPQVSGGAMFPFLEVFADAQAGISIAKGGASRLPEALQGIIEENDGEVRTGADVDRILTRQGRAVGVRLSTGEEISARSCVIANLTPGPLFGRLLREESFPEIFTRRIQKYTYGPGTMMIHLALSGRPKWLGDQDIQSFSYVHLAPYLEDLNETYQNALKGQLPRSPFLVVGQTSVVDPTRAPAGSGQEILWVQVRCLPFEIRGDSQNEITGNDWDQISEAYADRVMQKLEAFAPGIQSQVLDRKVYSPLDLQRENPNLVGGDSVGGSHHLRQNFLFRPVPGWSRYKTPIEGLYMCGAGTYPGAGVNAVSGSLVAQEVLAQTRKLESVVLSGALAGAGIWAVNRMRSKGMPASTKVWQSH